ncbi:MFS transporter [Actinoplanes missouriensis]|uniref:MFS transporter n=1 Tax=Actinoplanes missouriensis TaxID=1866 RepID=UPI0033D7D874
MVGLRTGPARTGPWMIAVATGGYLLSVWAWALPGPLAPLLRDELGLSPVQQALVVAIPAMIGSLGRMPVGALADRFGARALFLAVTLATIGALVVLALVGRRSVAALTAGVTLLGVAGTMFAAGVPFAGAWAPPHRRGLAIGVFGMGVCGSAIGGLTAVPLAHRYGITVPYLVCACALALFAALAAGVLRDPPQRAPATGGIGQRLGAALRLPITRQAGLCYAVVFGVFVTFTTYLPAYLNNAYRTGAAEAGRVMAVIVVVAVLARPAGGWLADRLAPRRPLVVALIAVTGATAVQAATPPWPVVVGVVLPVLAVALGVASAATLALVAQTAPASLTGLVTGVVTAIAGLAGLAGPLLLAVSLSRFGGYAPALVLLTVAAAAGALTATGRTGRTGYDPSGMAGPRSTTGHS